MSDEEKTTLDTAGIDKLMKAMKNAPEVRIGILGASPRTANDGSQLNNATVGLFAEVGTSKSPMRSFLRMPLIMQLNKRLKAAGVLEKDVLREAIKSGSLIPIMQKVGVIAEGIVLDAFDTGGFGQWKPSDMRYKENHQTLVETQQLRNSITSEVRKKA